MLMLPDSSGIRDISAANRLTVTISGFEPHAALAKLTPSTATRGVNEISKLRSPAIFRSRPVADFACSAINPLY